MSAVVLATVEKAPALPAGSDPARGLPAGLFHYIAATSWRHQIALLTLTVAVFLVEVVPLEIQRRVVNDVVKHRPYQAILVLCGVYIATVTAQGATKLALNLYRAWVGERAKRDLRRRISPSPRSGAGEAAAQGTAVSMMIAEVEPVGSFVGSSVSEPLLQAGILVTVISYVLHISPSMGLAAMVLFLPQLVFVSLMQRGMNRRTGIRVWLLRKIGGEMLQAVSGSRLPRAADSALIDKIFQLNMGIFKLKFSMNFLMNLCTHLQVVAALLLGAWWVLQDDLEAGAIVAFISAIGRLTDPWGDLVNYFREFSVTVVKYQLLAEAAAD